MPDSREQAQFRQHLSELRQATAGLGRDFAQEFTDLDTKIERFGRSAAKDARYLASDIQDDLHNLGRAVDLEMRRLPDRFANAGAVLQQSTVRAAGAARDAVVTAGKRAKEGTKNALAAAAGVRRTPMKQWSAPGGDEESPPREGPG
jgi:hypothetical protein